jgi:hypothetical protein
MSITTKAGRHVTLPTAPALGVPIPLRISRDWNTETTVANGHIALLYPY